MRRAAFTLSLLALTALAGCSGSSSGTDGGPTDAGPVDAGPTDAGYDATCSQPGTPGNSLGVGRFCTQHGSECVGQHAFICTVKFDPTVSQWFCTIPCACDAECGEGAICTGDPSNPASQRGCVPVVCAGGQSGTPTCPSDGGNPDAGDGG